MKHTAHNYFWITAALIILVRAVEHAISGDTTLDINVHDTYYIIDHWYVTIILVLIYFILGAAYWVLYKAQIVLSKKLTKAHTVITVLAVPAYYILSAYCNITNDPGDFITDKNYEALNTGILLIIFSMLLVQPLFIINIILSLVRRKKA